MIEAKQIHFGQARPYGDSVYEWQVIANGKETTEQVNAWCKEHLLNNRDIPTYHEHIEDYRISGDLGNYFRGYYELQPLKTASEIRKNEMVYNFRHVVPYCD